MSSYSPSKEIYCEEYDNCPDFLERYLAYMKNNQGKRPLTVTDAALTLREFCQYVHYRKVVHARPSVSDAHKDIGISEMDLKEMALSRSEIEEYLSFLENVAANAPSTLKKKLCILNAFYTYLCMIQEELGEVFLYRNPVAGIRICAAAATPPEALSIPQVQRLLEAAAGALPERDRAILFLLATTGITLSEVVALRQSDLIGSSWLLVRSKNGDRYLYLTSPCRVALRRHLFLEENRVDTTDVDRPIFAKGYNHQPITPRTVRNIVARAALIAGLQDLEITPKILRDTVADVLCRTATEHEQANVSAYLGYRMRLPKNSPASRKKRNHEDPTMERIVERSPLAGLGRKPPGLAADSTQQYFKTGKE